MTRNAKIVLLLIAAAGLAGVAGFWFMRPADSHDDAAPAAAPAAGGTVKFLMEQQWLIHMKLAKAEEAMVAPQITSTGRVVAAPANQAVVAPPVGGIISSESLPRIGQIVARGQLLATLIQTPTAAESAQIRVENARLDADRRRLAQAATESQVRLNLARTEFERASRLYEKKAYSLKQLQVAEADYKAAEAGLAAITEQLSALTPAASAPASTAYQVRSPISGTVVEVRKANGEQVQPGEAILQIVNLDTVWIEAPIFERDLGRLTTQKRATFSTTSFPDIEFHGSLVNIGAVIDERSRAATAIFEVPNLRRVLRIGMQANVRMDADVPVKALLIPKEAVLENEGKKIVYVLLSGEEFQRREIQVGDEYGEKVAVLSGIEPGQRVVTQGAYQLKLQELRPAGAVEHTHEV
jgi:cobalt-zinc-cadmium efflux system membrane fusion protein